MRIEIQHKLTTMWNMKRKHKVIVRDLSGQKLKTFWLNKDGSNREAINAEIEKLQ